MRVSDMRDLAITRHGPDAFSRDKFSSTMRSFGYTGSDSVLSSIFSTLDGNGNGTLGIDELYLWMSGGAGRLQLARKVTLLRGRSDRMSLEDIEWMPEELQRQLQLMLMWNGLAPLDLLQSWDEDNTGEFSFREWLRMMKHIIHPQGKVEGELWDMIIRPVVQLTFRQISGFDNSIDVVEFERFLNHGWRAARARMQRQKAGLEPVDDLLLTATAKRVGRAWRMRRVREAASGALKKPEVPRRAPACKGIVDKDDQPAPSAKAVARRAAPRLPEADRTPGWEVRDYLTRLCTLAEVPRPASEQWHLLKVTQQQFHARQQPRR